MIIQWQSLISLLTLSCTVLSVALMWRRDRRETRSSLERIQEQQKLLRSNAISRSIAVLRTSLSPLRKLYLHLDDDERLNEELKLVFGKPEVSREIGDSHAVVIEFDSLHGTDQRIRLARRISIAVGILMTLGFILHVATTLVDDTSGLSTISWLMLCFAVEAAFVIAILSVWHLKIDRRIQAIHQHRPEQN